MRSQSSISLDFEQLEDRCVPSSNNVVGGIIDTAPVLVGPTQLVATHTNTSASLNGASKASQIPAFYEGTQVTVNMNEQANSASLIAHNKSINTIYAYADLDEPQPFAPVIDAIQGEGFNPLWQQVLIVFNDPSAAHQFTSEDQVLAAAQAGEITLVTTDEVYKCAVVSGTGHGLA